MFFFKIHLCNLGGLGWGTPSRIPNCPSPIYLPVFWIRPCMQDFFIIWFLIKQMAHIRSETGLFLKKNNPDIQESNWATLLSSKLGIQLVLILVGSLEYYDHMWSEKGNLVCTLFVSAHFFRRRKKCKHSQSVLSYYLIYNVPLDTSMWIGSPILCVT